ncbi:MAG: hypothetical protein MMC23_009009 [Stictis urceolatum]|nr:hypothetical protein [Stictis urceolata]
MADAVASPSPYGFGFVELSPTVFYRTPSDKIKPSGASITKEPDLILLASWMDASPRHVAKYATGLQRIFPLARVLLITTSTLHFLVTPASQRLRDLEPALDILKNLQPQEKVLLHAFSNGGVAATWLVAKTHRARTGQALPISKAIIDSAPGTQGYSASLAAFSMALPKNPMARAIGSGFLRILLGVWFSYKYVSGGEMIVDTVRKGLNDAQLIPTKAVRLYVYSAADKLIPWQDVESHAKDAQAKGYRVQKVKYLESGHAAHLLHDEKRYWNAVTGLWDSDYLSSPGLIVSAW